MSYARTLMGELVGRMELSGQRTAARSVTLLDGAAIRVSFDGTTHIADISTPSQAGPEAAPETTSLWVPRGFVLYPAWHDAPFGVGLPVRRADKSGPYDPINLRPGLDRARWTAGGPCGEVLVSRDTDAGYPQDPLAIPSPLLYADTAGPGFRWRGKGNFQSRPAGGAWTGYRIAFAPFVAHYPDESAAAQRDLFEAVNAYRVSVGAAAAYLRPLGFYRPAEVMASIMAQTGSDAATAPAYPVTYRTPAQRLNHDGYPADWRIGSFDGFGRDDAFAAHELRFTGGAGADAIAHWKDAPADAASLEADLGPSVFADVGFRDGHMAADLYRRDRWLQAGNASWQSSDPDLPPLTWHSFASLNLAWETYPAVYDISNRATKPLVPLYAFTDNAGDCWLNYVRSKAPDTASSEPALGRNVYARGRAIALAPNGALVWAAGAMQARIGEGEDARDVDRLIILAHHPDDQPSDYQAEGWTRYLRVWWCDVPPRTLRLDPDRTICGTDAGDPFAWRGGTVIDVGVMPRAATGPNPQPGPANSLKYDACWRFSPDGAKAACLRDYAALPDYAAFGYSGVFHTLASRTVELVFAPLGDGDMNTQVTFHDYLPSMTAPQKKIDKAPQTSDAGDPSHNKYIYQHPVKPLAVDYDDQGRLIYAFVAEVDNGAALIAPAYTYLGTGSGGALYAEDLDNLVLFSSRVPHPTVDLLWSYEAQVASVRAAAFVVGGSKRSQPCWPFTDEGVHGAAVMLGGGHLGTTWFACPDGAIFDYFNRPYAGGDAVLVELPLAASALGQAYYVQKGASYVFTYQCAPMPGAAWTFRQPPAGCLPTGDDLVNRALLAYDDLHPRGGRVVSNIPLPDMDWSIYAKVV